MSELLSRLDGVRQIRSGHFIARCPAHDDRTPSLTITFCEDSRILLHCFAGCEVEDVCAAIGLTLSDLMPDRPLDHHKRRLRATMPTRDALVSIDHEAVVVALIANDIHDHQEVDARTLKRLAQAVERIGRARDATAPARHKP